MLDILYSGCSFGQYRATCADVEELMLPRTLQILCSLRLRVMFLPMEKLNEIRSRDSLLDKNMSEYQKYCHTEGVPLCDFFSYRKKSSWKIKGRQALKRMAVIVRVLEDETRKQEKVSNIVESTIKHVA